MVRYGYLRVGVVVLLICVGRLGRLTSPRTGREIDGAGGRRLSGDV